MCLELHAGGAAIGLACRVRCGRTPRAHARLWKLRRRRAWAALGWARWRRPGASQRRLLRALAPGSGHGDAGHRSAPVTRAYARALIGPANSFYHRDPCAHFAATLLEPQPVEPGLEAPSWREIEAVPSDAHFTHI